MLSECLCEELNEKVQSGFCNPDKDERLHTSEDDLLLVLFVFFFFFYLQGSHNDKLKNENTFKYAECFGI